MGGKKKKSAAQAATPTAAVAAGRNGAAAAGGGVAEEAKNQPANNQQAKPAKETKSKGSIKPLSTGVSHSVTSHSASRSITVPLYPCFCLLETGNASSVFRLV